MLLRLTTALLAATLTTPAFAQKQPTDVAVSPAVRREVVEGLIKTLASDYVFPDVATSTGKALTSKLQSGAYDGDNTAAVFADHLGRDLRASGHDRHLRVTYSPGMQFPPDNQPPPVATKADLDDEREWVNKKSAGIAGTKILPGNIGYLDIREFMPGDFVTSQYLSAMTLLSRTDGIVIDLRQNIGGDPHTVALLLSYFFAENDGRHLNDIYWRKDASTDRFDTFPIVGPRFLGPVYVLTSPRTFSAGEECAYDFQTQKRATLVGAVTGGGANPGGPEPLVHGFVVGMPRGRAINPVTKSNWEHVGVRPDTQVSAGEALQVAYIALLRVRLRAVTNPADRKDVESALSHAEKGDWDKLDFTAINADL
jgi:hypothetical protein